MNHSPTDPSSGRLVPRPALSPAATVGRIVWLYIAFSACHPNGREVIDGRLLALLRRSGIGCWTGDRCVLLLGQQRPITPADWSAVIGWLLCQPEVVFVARVFPITRRNHGQAQ